MNTIVVVPTFNEASNVGQLCSRLSDACPDAHLLIVDDASPDGTADVATSLFAQEYAGRHYRVLRRSGPRGLGRAYRDGFREALACGCDRVVQMDADLSHDPRHLPAMLEASAAADLVIGSRYCAGGRVENWPGRRLLLSRFAVWYVRKVAGIPVSDATAGYRCWKRSALEAIDIGSLHSEGYSFQVETCHRAMAAGLTVVETPIVFTDRRHGRSKISRSVLVESFVMPWRLRLRPWRPGVHVAGAAAPSAEF